MQNGQKDYKQRLKSDMDNAGLTDIIEGRAALYDEEMAAAE